MLLTEHPTCIKREDTKNVLATPSLKNNYKRNWRKIYG
jgi:hypothetical protein